MIEACTISLPGFFGTIPFCKIIKMIEKKGYSTFGGARSLVKPACLAGRAGDRLIPCSQLLKLKYRACYGI